jgi:hypothetical protein
MFCHSTNTASFFSVLMAPDTHGSSSRGQRARYALSMAPAERGDFDRAVGAAAIRIVYDGPQPRWWPTRTSSGASSAFRDFGSGRPQGRAT